MSIPLHLWLKDIDGSDIRGSSQVAGREGSIEVLGFRHGLHASADGVTGQLLGSRLHMPLVIEKEVDRSSPILYMRLARGDTLQSAEIKWYRVNEAGRETEYFNMTMRNVKIVAVTPEVPNIKNAPSQQHNHIEKLCLRYEEITWTYLDGNLQYRDAWSS
ncbi:type VI secretion system tube protein Hcp [Dyella sp. M7H15-1]|uniref:Hcp family type VI secretion system effector n=1 Tax=Dyella sp. M7H15-1 TaxID=2501295 RepID=UPI001004FD6E|nr:type VI secretion system tube protein TssD [Dyella sp. M7H15-1]QAU24965.1 type VI secretion system tube protein Hcp [Dyella sp. M7H15-1]